MAWRVPLGKNFAQKGPVAELPENDYLSSH